MCVGAHACALLPKPGMCAHTRLRMQDRSVCAFPVHLVRNEPAVALTTVHCLGVPSCYGGVQLCRQDVAKAKVVFEKGAAGAWWGLGCTCLLLGDPLACMCASLRACACGVRVRVRLCVCLYLLPCPKFAHTYLFECVSGWTHA